MRNRAIRVGGLSALAVLALAAAARADAPTVNLLAPRPFGYFAGDIVRLEAVVDPGDGRRLNAASLPRPRPLLPWLDLRAVAVEEEIGGGRRVWRVRLDYQLLDAPLEAAERVIPPLTLKAEGADGRLADAVIPQWRLLMAPLRGALPAPAPLMADTAIPLASPARPALAMAAAAFGALASLMLLAHHRAWPPFRRRRARPFTQAWRTIRAGGAYGDGLIALHRAFDAAAGRRVFSADIGPFLDTRVEFRPARHEIARFFEASRRAFFAGDMAGAEAQHPAEALAALSHRLSRLERRGGA